MAKVNIKTPEKFHFETIVPVRIDDINYGNHLSNDKYLSIAFEARFRFYKHYGFEELNLDGTGTIMAYANLNYLAEVKYGEQLLVQIALRDLSSVRFELMYLLSNKESGKEVARIETGIVCYDYDAKKVVPVPESFKQHFV